MYKEDFNPNGVKIYFDEDEHKYWTDNVKDFISVTSYVETFFPTFDKIEMSKRYAAKHGLKQSDVLSDWERKNKQSIELGINVHLFCENYLMGRAIPEPVNSQASKIFEEAKRKLDHLLKYFDIVACEKIVFSEKLKLCGTADLLVREKKTDKLYLLDFKTNKKIEKENRFRQYALNPFSHLNHNNFTHYSIQLNLYRKLFHIENYYSENIYMGIIHFSPDSGPVSHRIEPMERDVSNMLKRRLKN